MSIWTRRFTIPLLSNLSWKSAAKWLAIIFFSSLAGFYLSLDPSERSIYNRWAMHYMHVYFDPTYINAEWRGRKWPSPNYSSRDGQKVNVIVIHYTGEIGPHSALQWMVSPMSNVSAHYMIDETGRRYQLVPEEFAAWQAGFSAWHDATNLNESSIGIELVNSGHEPYTPAQVHALVELCKSIMERYHIAPRNVVAHSDISPHFKRDPGTFLDWAYLAQNGVGLWPDIDTKPAKPFIAPGDVGEEVLGLQHRLKRFGYNVPPTAEYDKVTMETVSAFQRHYRPGRIDGKWDADCNARLTALLTLAGESTAKD